MSWLSAAPPTRCVGESGTTKSGKRLDAIEAAIKQAQQSTQPTMIEVKTTIGYGAPNGGTNKVHGAPLGEEGRQAMADFYSWSAAPFEIAPAIRQRFETAVRRSSVSCGTTSRIVSPSFCGVKPRLDS
ncbi:hypothetical protein PND17_09630 [Streptococcus thermophilus]|nr:hypothetical protein [Streptococcus thermophilus]WCL61153.1 hypothetical protein PND17_09630 [Streptococcus thermophilus]